MKIQTVFDALDQDFPKKALQLCIKVLKKYPESQIFQALSALSFVRIGQHKKALEICEILKKNVPTDQDVLNVLQVVFKELNMKKNIVEIFENAFVKRPNDESLARNWFFSMVRTNNIIGQQKAALSLQKTFVKREYYYWAVMSLQLLKMERISESEKQIFQTLAYRMMVRVVEKTDEIYMLSSSEELYLYIDVLLSCNKLEDAIDTLNGDLGERFMNMNLFRLKLDLLFRLEKWALLSSQCLDYIDHGNNDWKVFDMHIISEINLAMSDPSSSEVISNLVNYYKEKKEKLFLRNLHLAFLKLSFLTSVSSTVEDKFHSCIQYFEIFGTKMCCFEDLRPFVRKLGKEYQIMFLVYIREFCDKVKLHEMKRNYVEILKNVEKFEYFINYYELKDEEAWTAFFLRLIDEYGNSLFLDDDLSSTNNQYGDDFLILAVHALINTFFITNKQNYLIHAILLLELGLLHSKHNFQFKLLLIRLYFMIGAFSLALSVYQSLSIKQIQYDTLSYIFLTKCSNYYPSKSLQNELKIAKYIYISNIRETPEMLVLAYENNTYSNIDNFIEFATRLNNSIWRHILRQESWHLSYLIDNKIFDETIEDNGFTEEKYYDNRDFTIMTDFGVAEEESIQVKSRITLTPDENWLKLQNFKMSFLTLLASGTIEDIKAKLKLDERLLYELKFDTLSEFEIQTMYLLRIFSCFLIQEDNQKIYNIHKDKLKEWIQKNLVFLYVDTSDYNHIIPEHLVFLFESCKNILLFESFIKRCFKTQKNLHSIFQEFNEIIRKFYNDIVLFISSLKNKISIDVTKFITLFEPKFELFKMNEHFIMMILGKISESRKNSLDNLDHIICNIKL
ncbi:hypothetical protein PCANB_002724 [Pneumocystis canis]|nr:hypothetical protein PCANB_002724 [Pneumocystis canis]